MSLKILIIQNDCQKTFSKGFTFIPWLPRPTKENFFFDHNIKAVFFWRKDCNKQPNLNLNIKLSKNNFKNLLNLSDLEALKLCFGLHCCPNFVDDSDRGNKKLLGWEEFSKECLPSWQAWEIFAVAGERIGDRQTPNARLEVYHSGTVSKYHGTRCLVYEKRPG